MEYPFVIGTAGHIDHGKTGLVKALTGVDCDRLGEEKKRGITIELGFAPLTLPSGRIVSIVDVPGHERFIRQMAAGAAGIDAVILVIAADEGAMPQTREHLDILGLLGVKSGLVVLSKCDLVDAELLELAKADVESLVEGTFLEDALVVTASSVTGEGIQEIARIVDGMLDENSADSANAAKNSRGAFFMPIDRVFGMKGFGSVVTGTVYSGKIEAGRDVDIKPSSLRAKIRSIQVHGKSSESAEAGQRAAINLASVSLEQLNRGDVLCEPAKFMPTSCFDTEIRLLASSKEPLFHWQRVRLHVGTSDVIARISLLAQKTGSNSGERTIEPGETGMAQVFPESPLVVTAGQRFIMRFYSPLITIGGGRVLLPHSERETDHRGRIEKNDALLNLARDLTPLSVLEAIIGERGILAESDLFALSQMGSDDFALCASKLKEGEGHTGVKTFGSNPIFYISEKAVADFSQAIVSILTSFHSANPELAGLDSDELRSSLFAANAAKKIPGMQPKDFKEFLKFLRQSSLIGESSVAGETRYSAPGFKARGDDALLLLASRLTDTVNKAGFEMQTASELSSLLGASMPEINRAIGYLREKEGLKVIGEGLVLTSETAERIRNLVRELGEITVGSVRDAMGTSRKYALAALEFLDAAGVTRRVGDKRVLLK